MPPTSKTSDERILEIYREVLTEFQKAAQQKNEHIPAPYLNTIAFKFISVNELMGEEWYREHLKYEINKYFREGLREDYKKELNLF